MILGFLIQYLSRRMFSFLTGQEVDDGLRKPIDIRFNCLRNINHIFFVKDTIFISFIFTYISMAKCDFFCTIGSEKNFDYIIY